MTARGYVWGLYVADDGAEFAWRVDADYFAMAERGWALAPSGTNVFPRFWNPRRVVGHDSVGNRQTAIVATTTADLWTGAATTFTINGSDELPHSCTVDFTQGEKSSARP